MKHVYLPKAIAVGAGRSSVSLYVAKRWLGLDRFTTLDACRRHVTDPSYPKGHPNRTPSEDYELLAADWSGWQWFFDAVEMIDARCAKAGHARRTAYAMRSIRECFRSRDNAAAIHFRPEPSDEYTGNILADGEAGFWSDDDF